MNRMTATALALAMMIGGAGGALAQGTTAPATGNAPAATAPAAPAKKMMKKAPVHKMARRTTHRMNGKMGRATVQGSRATEALNLLSANGYTGVSDFAVSGKMFTATATQNGKSVPVTIDVDTKTVKAGS